MKTKLCQPELIQNKLHAQAGFTLIELLIALSVSAVIAVLSYQAINSMVNVKSSVNSHAQESEQLQRIMWRMQQDLTQLAPRAVLDQLGSVIPAFQYREDTGLEFTRIAQFPTADATAGLLRVGYVLENETLYRLTWNVLDRAQDTEPKRVKLFDDVRRFEVAMLDSSNKWQTNWPMVPEFKTALPKVTQITIESEQFGTINRWFMGVN